MEIINKGTEGASGKKNTSGADERRRTVYRWE